MRSWRRLSPELADGEEANGSTEAVRFHLRSCAACRAKLRAYRAIPEKVFELMPAGPLLDQSMGGGPHEWIAERVGAAADKVRELGYSVLARGGGGSGDAASVVTAGGTRGAGMAAVAKMLAVCGATAAGSAACVASGVVDPGAIGGGGNEKPAVERPAEPTATTVPVDQAEPPATDQAAAPKAPDQTSQAAPEPTPVQQQASQLGIEATPSASSSPTSSDFGGPSGGGGGSSGGGSSGGGFGIEK